MDYNIEIEKSDEFRGIDSLCDGNESATFVWPDYLLVLICESVWRNRKQTLKFMIDDQKNQVNQKEIGPNDVQLDNRVTMGGVMMHVFAHAFGSRSFAIIK